MVLARLRHAIVTGKGERREGGPLIFAIGRVPSALIEAQHVAGSRSLEVAQGLESVVGFPVIAGIPLVDGRVIGLGRNALDVLEFRVGFGEAAIVGLGVPDERFGEVPLDANRRHFIHPCEGFHARYAARFCARHVKVAGADIVFRLIA